MLLSFFHFYFTQSQFTFKINKINLFYYFKCIGRYFWFFVVLLLLFWFGFGFGCIHVCVACIHQKTASDSLGLELQTFGSHHVGTGN